MEAGQENPPLAPQVLLTSAIGRQHELIEATLLLAWKLAEKQGSPLGFRVVEPLKAALFASFPPPLQHGLDEQGEASLNSVRLVDLTTKEQMESFAGVVLLVGDDLSDSDLIDRLHSATVVVVVPESDDRWNIVASQYPDAIGARLVLQGQTVDLSASQKDGVQWFDKNYGALTGGYFDPTSSIVKLGEGQDRVCRYCGRATPEVSFSNTSHAFPEQIGNKKLTDLLECDSCNSQFSRTLEDSFGKWSLPVRNTSRIKGKKNRIPTYRSGDQRVRVDHASGKLNIAAYKDDGRVEIDLDAKELRLRLERQPYVPLAVFKSFVKMALAVIPEPEASQCSHLKQWILEPTHTAESLPFKPLTLFTQFAPGPLPNDKVSYLLLRRKDGVAGCPYLMFVVQYANYIHQIVLPMPRQDLPEGRATMNLRYVPNPWDTPAHEEEFGKVQLIQTDLSSPDVAKGDAVPMSFAFDSATDKTDSSGN